MSVNLLLSPSDEDSEPFFEGCRRGELRMQQCAETGKLIFPPRPMSPFAPHTPPTWTTLSGEGTIWSFCVPHPPLLPPFQELAPYVVCLVALVEDPTVRLLGNVVTRADAPMNELHPEQIAIGARVRALFREEDGEPVLPRWLLLDPAAG